MLTDEITINIQHGSGNTQYTGPVQINNYAAPEKPALTCYICGRRDADVRDQMFGNCHPECERQGRIEAQHRAERLNSSNQWSVIESYPVMLLEQCEEQEPLQIAAPVEPEYILVRDDPQKYESLPRPYYVPLVRKQRA